MQLFLKAASQFCVYNEWRTRCKSCDTCRDIAVWLKNGVPSHSYIGHRYKIAGNDQNLKPVQFCTGFKFYAFSLIVTAKIA